MEVHITSKQMVKPSSSNLHLLKPFKLSLLDQLTPRIYNPVIFFYPKPNDSDIDSSQFSEQLKRSFSKALAQFYPFAGRIKNNTFVSDYDKGVPYVETRVNGRLSDIIRIDQELETLNQLLPCKPFWYVQDTSIPLSAVQVNIFDCGGIALGSCLFHTLCDGVTNSAFFRSWTAFSRGSNGELPNPGLLEAASQFFPAIKFNDLKGLLYKQLAFFKEGRPKTRTFVFDAKAIDTLLFKIKSKSLEHPSRALSLTAFLWKHAIKASRSASGTIKPSVVGQPVNIRHKTNPPLPDYSIGNLIFHAITAYFPAGNDIELNELAHLLKEAAQSIVTTDLRQGFKTSMEQLNQAAKIGRKGNADFYAFSSWLNIVDGEEDFGWGKPSVYSIPGVDRSFQNFNNLFFLKRARQHNAIEAWVTLSEEEMGFLEREPEFFVFTSPTPPCFDKINI